MKKNIVFWFIGLSTLIGFLSFWLYPNDVSSSVKNPITKNPPVEEEYTLDLGLDPPDKTVHQDPMVIKPKFPNEDQVKLIGRLGEGIKKFKMVIIKRANLFHCGERITEEKDIEEYAMLWAYHIVKASWEAERNLGDKRRYHINPWGVAGTVANESSFDLCALGLHPRRTAYKLKNRNGTPVLKQRKTGISHTREEVLAAINNKQMKKKFKSFDLGGLQTLTKYWSGHPKHLLTWEGFYFQVALMAKRGWQYKTKRPWSYWRGRYTLWYDKKVTRRARKLGATVEDLPWPPLKARFL